MRTDVRKQITYKRKKIFNEREENFKTETNAPN